MPSPGGTGWLAIRVSVRGRPSSVVFACVLAVAIVVASGTPARAAPQVLFSAEGPLLAVTDPVPAGICFVRIVAAGGAGGEATSVAAPTGAGNGGAGAEVRARVPVAPGTRFEVLVAGAGRLVLFPEGGLGGGGGGSGNIFTVDGGIGGAGGGASVVATLVEAVLVVAGGGGGGSTFPGAFAGNAGLIGHDGEGPVIPGVAGGTAPGAGGRASGQGGDANHWSAAGGGVNQGGRSDPDHDDHGGAGGTGDGIMGGGGGGAGDSNPGGLGGPGGAGGSGTGLPGASGGGGLGGHGSHRGGDGGDGAHGGMVPFAHGSGGGGGLGFGGGGGAGGLDVEILGDMQGAGGGGYGAGGGHMWGGGGGSSFVTPAATEVSSELSEGDDGYVTISFDPQLDACSSPEGGGAGSGLSPAVRGRHPWFVG